MLVEKCEELIFWTRNRPWKVGLSFGLNSSLCEYGLVEWPNNKVLSCVWYRTHMSIIDVQAFGKTSSVRPLPVTY